jgi:hypothetical protein
VLFEPFLIPSILCATQWLSLHSFGAGIDVEVLLTIMKELVKTGKDAPRDTILAVSRPQLAETLENIRTHLRKGDDVEPLLQILARHSPYQRRSYPAGNTVKVEPGLPGLEQYTPDFDKDFDMFCTWSIGLVPTAPHYSHANFLRAVRKFGTMAFVSQLIQCVVRSIQGGLGDLALDLAVSLISALYHSTPRPNSDSDEEAVSGQDALRLELSRTPKYARKESLRVRITILLARRIDNELTNAPLLNLTVADTSFLDNIDMSNMPDLPIDLQQLSSTLEALPESAPMHMATEPNFGFDGTADTYDLDNIDINAALAAQDTSGQALSAFSASGEDDIYAGLNFDNMDWS